MAFCPIEWNSSVWTKTDWQSIPRITALEWTNHPAECSNSNTSSDPQHCFVLLVRVTLYRLEAKTFWIPGVLQMPVGWGSFHAVKSWPGWHEKKRKDKEKNKEKILKEIQPYLRLHFVHFAVISSQALHVSCMKLIKKQFRKSLYTALMFCCETIIAVEGFLSLTVANESPILHYF